MRKSLFILTMGLLALTARVDAQIKLYNNGGIAIGDTTDPGSEKTVFYDDVTFNGNVTGITFPDSIGGSDNLFDNGTSSYFTGKLGIGTGTPGYPLHVSGGAANAIARFESTDRFALLELKDNVSTFSMVVDGDANILRFSDAASGGGYNILALDGANNRVGIGTTTPDYNVEISASTPTLGFQNTASSNKVWSIRGVGNDLYFTETGVSDRVVIKAGGNVGIGTTTPQNAKLVVDNGLICAMDNAKVYMGDGVRAAGRAEIGLFSNGVNAVSEVQFGHTDRGSDSNVRWAISDRGVAEGTLHFYAGPGTTGGGWVQAMTIDNSYNVGIGDATPSYRLDVNGTGRFTGALTASTLSLSGTMSLSNGLSVTGTTYFNSNILAYSDLLVYGTFTEMSDRTLKTDITELDVNSLGKIASLQAVTYRFIADKKRNTRTGFIAQDVQKVFPELVSEQEDGLAIKTLEIIPHLVEAIKEQQEIIESLELRIRALEEKKF